LIYSTFYGLFRAETPLNHGADEKMETTSLCRYNTVLLEDGKEVKVYNISVAAYRHNIREFGCHRLLNLLGLFVEDLPEISNVIFLSGGPRLEKGEVAPLEFIRFIRQWFPLLDLMGCTTPFTMISGKFTPTAINVLAREVAEANFFIEGNILDLFGITPESLPSVVTEFQFNSKRDTRTEIFDIANTKNTDCGTVANIFDTQVVRKGARLGHQVMIRDYDNKMLESCLSSALREWQRSGCHVGGKINQGCGQVSLQYAPSLVSPEIYENFVIDNASKIKNMVLDKKIWMNKEISPYR